MRKTKDKTTNSRPAPRPPMTPGLRNQIFYIRALGKAGGEAVNLLGFCRLLLLEGYEIGTIDGDFVVMQRTRDTFWREPLEKNPGLGSTFQQFIDERSDYAPDTLAFKKLAARLRWIWDSKLMEDLPLEVLEAAAPALVYLKAKRISDVVGNVFKRLPSATQKVERHELFVQLLQETAAAGVPAGVP
jgi:hypothetical protein